LLGKWSDSMLLYDALAQSENVPSLRVLDGIGFDAAIDRAAALLGYTDPDEIRRRFPRVYPLGLGINTTSPLRMARAFSIFANQGREVTPIAIRSVEDRNGKVALDVERDLRLEQRRKGNAIQVISPQNAYIMTSLLKKTVEIGTLANPSGWGSKFIFKDENGKNFKMPMAGKTGTPQNWSDAWTIGFSPYYTTAIWFGFDKPGNSLGVNLTGSTLAGPVWADYMREIHQGLSFRDFVRPTTGIVDVTVCAKSGLLKTPYCNEGDVTLPFLEGTQPVLPCNIHDGSNGAMNAAVKNIETGSQFINTDDVLKDLSMPVLRDPTLMNEIQNEQRQQSRMQSSPGMRNPSSGRITSSSGRIPFNPFLDDVLPPPPPPQASAPVIPNSAPDIPGGNDNAQSVSANPDTAAPVVPDTSTNVTASPDDSVSVSPDTAAPPDSDSKTAIRDNTPDASQSDASQSDASQSDASQSDASQSDTSKSGASVSPGASAIPQAQPDPELESPSYNPLLD